MLALSIGLLATAWLWRRAEAERVHADSARREAEADFQLANEVLEGFAESTSIRYFDPIPAAYWESKWIPILLRGRKQLLALAQRRPDHLAAQKWLAGTDNRLAGILINNGEPDEARALLVEAQQSLDRVIAEAPTDPALLKHQLDKYVLTYNLADAEGKVEDAIDYRARALAVHERLLDVKPTRALVTDIAERRHELAGRFAQIGQEARARSLIEANVRMLDHEPHAASEPAIAIRRLLAHEDLRQLGTNTWRRPNAATAVAGTDPLSRLISPEADDLSAEVWASVVIQLFPVNPTSGGTPPALDSGLIEYFALRVAGLAAERRHAGRLDQARRIADRLHAFTSRLVTRSPEQSAAHWALSEAYMQICKNAWQTDDRAAIERYLRLSLGAAKDALVLDPDNARTRDHLAACRERLAKLLSPPKPVGAGDLSARTGMRN